MQVHNAANIGPDAVDGTVGTEATGVHTEGGGPLLDHLTQDVDLYLMKQRHQQLQSEETTQNIRKLFIIIIIIIINIPVSQQLNTWQPGQSESVSQ